MEGILILPRAVHARTHTHARTLSHALITNANKLGLTKGVQSQ